MPVEAFAGADGSPALRYHRDTRGPAFAGSQAAARAVARGGM